MLTVCTHHFGEAVIRSVARTREPPECVVHVQARTGARLQLSLPYLRTLAHAPQNIAVCERLLDICETGKAPPGSLL